MAMSPEEKRSIKRSYYFWRAGLEADYGEPDACNRTIREAFGVPETPRRHLPRGMAPEDQSILLERASRAGTTLAAARRYLTNLNL